MRIYIMATFKTDLRQALRDSRELSESTTRTYVSLLHALQRKLRPLAAGHTVSFYTTNKDQIMAHIADLPKKQTRKTLLSALYVLTKEEDYRREMLENARAVSEEYRLQKTDPKRAQHWMSYEEIRTLHNQFKAAYKQNPSNANLMDLLISSLHSGAIEGLPPRRVLDYAIMKVREVNPEKDNYYDAKGKRFIFNQFKTRGHKGQQAVEVPKELLPLINKRVKSGQTHLLVNEEGLPYTQSALSKKIKRMFQGNTQDVLRSIFLSHLYKDVPAVSFLQDTADRMGHSVDSALSFYVKRDA